MIESDGPSIAAALEGLWIRFLPQLEERIAALEAANQSLSNGDLAAGQREDAHSAAHKLAGILGTFGLSEGTELAREAEILYSGPNVLDAKAATRLHDIAARLRSMIANRK